jgi:methionyl-tRNA formyltransferase
MKIIFLGTPSISLDVLSSLNKNHEIAAVVTQPDKPVKRSKELLPSPVALFCEKENLTVFKTEIFTGDLISGLKNLDADVFITFAYGVILKKDFFTVTRLGGINIHPSLLPELRGPSPIQTAIMLGKKSSGITIQTIKLKVDSGDILKQAVFDINESDDALTIEKKVSGLSAELILDVLKDFEKGWIKPLIQDESKATFSRIINKNDGLIDWNSDANDIFNRVRAFIKWPICHSFIDEKKINIYKGSVNYSINNTIYKEFKPGSVIKANRIDGITVKCRDSYYNLESLQIEGKKILDYKSFLNGNSLENKIFGSGAN